MTTALFEQFATEFFPELRHRCDRALEHRRRVAEHQARAAARRELAPAWEAAVARRAPRSLTGTARIARLPAAHLPLQAGVLESDTPVRWIGGAPQWGEGVLIDPIPAGTLVEIDRVPRRADAGAIKLTYPEGVLGAEDWADEDRDLVRDRSRTDPDVGYDWEAWGSLVLSLSQAEHDILDRLTEWRRSAGLADYNSTPAGCPVFAGLN